VRGVQACGRKVLWGANATVFLLLLLLYIITSARVLDFIHMQAYMQVAPQVASYPGYFAPLAWHLLHVKLHHWDKALRELAATALAGLVEVNPAFILQEALPHLLPLCTSSVLETRHGAIAAVAEILPALHAIRDRTAQEDINLPHAIACAIADVLPSIVRLNMGRGKGGEVIRGAVCRLIETISLTGVPLLTHQRACLYRMALENLHHPNETIQRGAASALAAFALHHLDRVMQQQDDRKRAAADNDAEDKLAHTLTVSNLLTRLIDDLRSGQPVHGRRGAALALGALPGCIVKPHEDEVFFSLAAATAIEEDPASRDVETRSYAAQALSRVALSLWSSADFQPRQEHEGRTGAGRGAITLLHDYVLTPLLHAMEDYTVDNRGDVGSRTREAAMRSLHDVLCMLAPHGILHVAQLAEQAFVLTLRQAVERIARVREVAGECLRSLSLVFADAGLAIAPQVAARANACSGESYSGGVAVASFAQLIGVPELREALLEGMVYSIGGLDAQLSELSAEALIDALSTLSHDDVATVANSFCAVWSKHFKTKRMATPLLTATEVVLSRSELRDLCKESRARDGFAAQLLRFVTGEIQGCTDVFRLHAAAGALCQLAGASCGDIQRESLSAIVTLFGNRFPKVRRYAAEQLYTALLAWDDGEDDVDVDVEGAMDVLTETPWDGDASVVRPARRRLGECLKVSLPEEQSSAAAQARLEEGERAVMEGRRAKAGGYAELLHQLEKGQH
jgi:tubulin-specific chaperone D